MSKEPKTAIQKMAAELSAAEMRRLDQMILQTAEENEGDISDLPKSILDYLENSSAIKEQKVVGYAYVIGREEANAKMYKGWKDSAAAKQKAATDNVERLKETALKLLDETGLKTIQSNIGKISWQLNPPKGPVISEGADGQIPDKFVKSRTLELDTQWTGWFLSLVPPAHLAEVRKLLKVKLDVDAVREQLAYEADLFELWEEKALPNGEIPKETRLKSEFAWRKLKEEELVAEKLAESPSLTPEIAALMVAHNRNMLTGLVSQPEREKRINIPKAGEKDE